MNPLILAVLYLSLFTSIAFGASVNYPGGIQAAQPAGCVRFDKTTYPYTFQSTGEPCGTADTIDSVLFASLGTPENGAIRYCTDCSETSPCTGSGSGAFAQRVNGTWRCAVTASAAFNGITSGTNTTAAMVVGSGASIDVTGTGSIKATQIPVSSSLSCSSSPGKIIGLTGSNGQLIYCDPDGLPSTKRTALGDSSGNATSGDSATSFFGAGTLELARGGTNQSSWTAGRCVQVSAGGTELESAAGACGSGSGSLTLDLGDDSGNDSTALSEIATTGDTNNIFTESSADKLLIAVGNDWPKADVAENVICSSCINLASEVTGTLDVASGGTGATTLSGIVRGNFTSPLSAAELSGDVVTSGSNATTIQANAVALGTDTTGNYALGDAEGGAATTGDSATSFFASGTIEAARLPDADDDATTKGIATWPDADVDCTSGSCSIASALTRDTEWDTAAEINAATTDTDFLTAEVDGSTTNEIEVVDETYNASNFNGGTTSAVSQDDLYDHLHVGDNDDDGLNDALENTVTIGTITDGSTSITVVSSDTNDIQLGFDDAVMSVGSTGTPAVALNDFDAGNTQDAIWRVSCSGSPANCNADHLRTINGSAISYLNASSSGPVILGGSGVSRVDITTDGTGIGEILLSPLTSNGFVKTNSGTGSLSVDTNTYLTAEVDGSTTNEIEVVDEAYSSANFNGGTTSAVSQDDFYDYNVVSDTDDDGAVDKIDTTSNGFVKAGSSNGTLSISSTVGDTEIANDAVDGGTGGEIQDDTITSADIKTTVGFGHESYRNIGTTMERWYPAGLGTSTNFAVMSSAITSLSMYAVPYFTGMRGGTIDRIALSISTAPTTGACRLCIYENTSQTTLYPNSLVSGTDGGSLTISGASGAQSITLSSAALPKDSLVWFVMHCEITSGNFTPVGVAINSVMAILGSDSDLAVGPTTTNGTMLVKSGETYGACPSTFPAGATVSSGTIPPVIAVRYDG